MSLSLFLQGLGSIGVFASRAFLPAFVTAILIRFGPEVSWLASSGLLPKVRDVPTWFTSDVSLIVLGILTAIELAAERFDEAKAVMDQVHSYLKTGMAVLTFLGVMHATDRSAVAPMLKQAGFLDFLPAMAVGVGVFVATQARAMLLAPLIEADEDDDLGLRKLIRWVEDLWAGLGPVALIVFPILTVAVFALAVVVLVVVERRVEARMDREKVGCLGCGELIHPSALACPYCHLPVKEPRAVGILGLPKSVPADIPTQPFGLVAAKRCPVCASRLGRRAVDQTCLACGHRLLGEPGFAPAYVRFLDNRVPLVLVACFVMGLVPILGVLPGVILYRLTIVAPFRRYIPTGQGFLLRWGVRLAILLLVSLQWVPVAGSLAVPTMAMINYAAYREAYRRLAAASDLE